MDIKEALYRILSGASAVTDIAGSNIYGGNLPQDITADSIVFRRTAIRSIPIFSTPQRSELQISSFRIGCVSTDFDVASALDEAVTAALEGYADVVTDSGSPESAIRINGAFRTDASDFFDDPTQTHWVRSEWEIAHSTT